MDISKFNIENLDKTTADKRLKETSCIESTKPRYNKETEKAMEGVKAGKTTKISLENFRMELYS